MAIADSSIAPRRISRGWRRAPAVLGGLLLAFIIAWGAFVLLDLASRHSFDVSASYGAVRSLEVAADAGDVRLAVGAPGSDVVVAEHVTEGLITPHREALRGAGGALHLRASCPTGLGSNCGDSYTIAVPPGVAVVAESGDGDVDARGLSTTTRLKLTSGNGDVNALGIRAPTVTLQSGNGNVTATLDRAPTRLDSSSGSGDVKLTVPNTTYAVLATSRNGNVSDATLRIDPSSPRKITASSGNGNVTIRAVGVAAP
jgi:hypothetical protein